MARGNRVDRRNRSAQETRERRRTVLEAIDSMGAMEFVATEIAALTGFNAQGVGAILSSLRDDGEIEVVRDEPERKVYRATGRR